MDRVILHCDMNNFYASVECMLDPDLRDSAVAVCGDTEERHGIVLAKNYKAAKFGIKTAETVWSAKQKCRDLVIVSPHFEQYMRFSSMAREIYKSYTPLVEPFGLDECWLDITDTALTLEKGEKIADEIRCRIKSELGVTVSVGVSFNKLFAKLGSDIKKPDAVTAIPKENYLDIIGDLPASALLGVGGATAEKLSVYCVETINDLASFSKNMLIKLFGKVGNELWLNANGLNNSPVVPREPEMLDQSVGNGVTTPFDLESAEQVWGIMLELSQELGKRLFECGKKASTVAIQIKDNILAVKQWQCPIGEYTQSAYVIAKKAFELFKASYKWEKPIRAVTVRAINLADASEPTQVTIFSENNEQSKNDSIGRTMLELRTRFGSDIIKNATVSTQKNMPKKKQPKSVLPK